MDMTMEAALADEFLRHLYAAWFLISTVGGHFVAGEPSRRRRRRERNQRKVATSIGSVLVRALWAGRDRIKTGNEPSNGPIGFSIAHDALWYRRDDIVDLLRPELLKLEEELKVDVPLDPKAYDLTYINRPFARRFGGFIDSSLYKRWRAAVGLDASGLLDPAVAAVLREAKVDEHAVGFPGIPIAGSCNALIWIALRTREQISERLSDVGVSTSEAPLRDLVLKLAPRARAKMIAADAEKFGKGASKHGSRATANHALPVTPPMVTQDQDWRSRLKALDHEAGSLLRTVACLNEVQVPPSVEVVRAIEQRTPERFHALLTQLEAEKLAVIDPSQPSDVEDKWMIRLAPTAQITILAGLQTEVDRDATLMSIIRRVAKSQQVAPDVRLRLLYHALTLRAFDDDPAARLELLVDLLPLDDDQRVTCAVKLAPHHPERAIAVVGEYLATHHDRADYWPACLEACADSNWDGFTVLWDRVATAAQYYTREIVAHLTTDQREEPWPLFAQKFWTATVSAMSHFDHVDELVGLFKKAFRGEHQVWTLWIATPTHVVALAIVPRLLAAVDRATLTPALQSYYDELQQIVALAAPEKGDAKEE